MTGRPFKVTIAESLEHLEKTLDKARTVSQKERLQMLVWLKGGEVSSRNELASRCGRDKATITRWVRVYKQEGLQRLLTVEKAPGATPKIQGEALEKLKARLAQPEGFSSYGEIQQWLEDTCALQVSYGTVYQLVRYRLKAKLKVPRPRSLQQEPQKLNQFQKKIALSLKGMKRLAKSGRRIRYLCQDETRLGLKTIPGRLITACGVKPLGWSQWQRQCFWLYGVVEPLTGFSFFFEFSHLDQLCFQKFLNLLSVELGDDIALMQLDQASAHTANGIVWPSNIFATFQPPHSPELNPIERFWLMLKKQLAWKNCSSLQQLKELLSSQLSTFSAETIASLTSYKFILEALFGAAL
jgi:transposase